MDNKFINILKITATLFVVIAFGAVCGEKFASYQSPNVEKVVINEEEIINKAAAEYFTSISHLNMVTVSDLKRDLNEYYLIDIRRSEDYISGHIPGSINIAMPNIGKEMTNFPNEQPILIICYSGEWSAQATGILRLAGYDARILESGFDAWKIAGYEVE